MYRVVQTGEALKDQQRLFESLMVQVEKKRSAVENSAKQIEDRLYQSVKHSKLMHKFIASFYCTCNFSVGTDAFFCFCRLQGVKIAHRKAENQIKMAKMIMMNELNKRANLLIGQLEVDSFSIHSYQ